MNFSLPKRRNPPRLQFKHASLDRHRGTFHFGKENLSPQCPLRTRLELRSQEARKLQLTLEFPEGQQVRLKLPLVQAGALRDVILKTLRAKKSLLGDRLKEQVVISCLTLEQDLILNNYPAEITEDINAFVDFAPLPQLQGNSIKKYSILRMLGEGGTGRVMLVRSFVDGRLYALKAISKTFLRSRGLFSMAENELLMLKTLSHPSIVQFYDSF
jgi:hypothetical protein